MAEKKRFNKTLLSSLIKEQQKVTVSDSEVAGLKFTVGSKRSTFHFEKRISGKKGSPITINLGAFPAISIEEARQEARRLANLCEKGRDPRKEKQVCQTENFPDQVLLKDAVAKFFEVKGKLSPRTLQKYQFEVTHHFPKKWHSQCLTTITPEILVQQFHEVRKTSRERCFEFLKVFNNTWSTCEPLFLNSKNQRILKENPIPLARQMIQHIKRDQPQRLIIPATALGKFVVLVEQWSRNELPDHDSGLFQQRFCHIVLLCLFTGMRGIEAKNLRWEYIDLNQNLITLPGRVESTAGSFHGTKNKREHLIPLSTYAAELIQQLHHDRQSISPFVFPALSSPHKPFCHHGTVPMELSQLTGIHFSLHACRRTFASIADEVGLDFLKVKRSLNHSFEGGVTGGYINPSFNPAKRREYFQMVCDYIVRCKAEFLGHKRREEQGFSKRAALLKVQRYALELGLSAEDVRKLFQESSLESVA